MSYLPWFSYDASTGGGSGSVTKGQNGRMQVEFDTKSLKIPPITDNTTRCNGLPLPPLLRIDIKPKTLKGWVCRSTGEIQLTYEAVFQLHAPFFSPPELVVRTVLSTELVRAEAKNRKTVLQGQRLDDQGHARLVGVSSVPKTGHFVTDVLLQLPANALAILAAKFEFKQ